MKKLLRINLVYKKILIASTLYILGFSLNAQTLAVNPNPCNKRTLATYTLLNSDTVSLFVVSITGMAILTVHSSSFMPAGIYQDSIILNASSPGIYFIKLQLKQGGSDVAKIISDPSVSINENNVNGLSVNVFPNPVKEKLFLRSNDNTDFVTATVNNVLGQTVSERFLITNNSEIDFIPIPTGIYFIRLKSAKGQSIVRVVKE